MFEGSIFEDLEYIKKSVDGCLEDGNFRPGEKRAVIDGVAWLLFVPRTLQNGKIFSCIHGRDMTAHP